MCQQLRLRLDLGLLIGELGASPPVVVGTWLTVLRSLVFDHVLVDLNLKVSFQRFYARFRKMRKVFLAAPN